jgi:hypothetical protein
VPQFCWRLTRQPTPDQAGRDGSDRGTPFTGTPSPAPPPAPSTMQKSSDPLIVFSQSAIDRG